MTIILSIISIFIFVIGALTFYASSEEAVETKRYEALATSTVMILIGVFCTVFFLFGIERALSAVLLTAIVLFVIHTIISYVSFGQYSFKNGKLQMYRDYSQGKTEHKNISPAHRVVEQQCENDIDDAQSVNR